MTDSQSQKKLHCTVLRARPGTSRQRCLMLFCSVSRIHCFIYLGFCHRQDQVRTKYTLCLTWAGQCRLQRDTGQQSILMSELHLRHWPCFLCCGFAEYSPDIRGLIPRAPCPAPFRTSVTEGFAVKWAGQEQSKWILKPANSSVPPTLLGSTSAPGTPGCSGIIQL